MAEYLYGGNFLNCSFEAPEEAAWLSPWHIRTAPIAFPSISIGTNASGILLYSDITGFFELARELHDLVTMSGNAESFFFEERKALQECPANCGIITGFPFRSTKENSMPVNFRKAP